MASLLSTGVSALHAYQTALQTTGHNISNVNTEGYSRQVVDLATRQPERFGSSWLGQGVNVTGVRRQYDDFLAGQVRSTTSAAADTEAYHRLATQLDNLVADDDLGLAPVLQRFFDSLQELSNDPSSVPVRQVVLAEADALADRFRFLDDRIKAVGAQVNSLLEQGVEEINAIAEGIADLNQAIVNAQGAAGSAPNDLLDQRDQLLVELAEFVSVSTVEQDDGALNVFIGNGQSLVLGGKAATLGTAPAAGDPAKLEMTLTSGGGSQVVTSQINGGVLGGALRFRDELLSQTQTSLDTIATALHDEVNAQHAFGIDLEGDSGGAFFSLSPTANPASSIAVAITDPRRIAAGLTAASGDNQNALALADLQASKVMNGGTTTLQGGYTQLVSEVGAKTSEAGIGARAQAGLLESAKLAQSEVSGVNLDEEAANLLRFQQAYQAAAQVISVAQTLFDTLIGAVRR